MKKFMITLLMVLVSVVAFATDVYKVKFVKIGTGDRGTEVICEGGKTFYAALREFKMRAFFNTLRSGDIVEVEEYENQILGIRKVGHEQPTTMTNGVIVENGNSYGGYYGGGYGSASIETKNVGVGYDPYTGIHVRVKGNYVNIPVRIKSKKANNSGYATNNGVVTASPATQVVRTVNATDLYNNSSAVSAPARTTRSNVSAPATRSNTSTRNSASSAEAVNGVRVYSGSVAGMF